MLPAERQKRIREWLQEKQSVKISELSAWLDVSEMTIHRDVKSLIAEGFAEKTFGGIMLKAETQTSYVYADMCAYCSRPVKERLAYRLIMSDHTIKHACCAHCGLLLHQQYETDAVQAICHDFLMETTISALQAWYVMDSSLNIGCCQPQVLSFDQKHHAQQFADGFGGAVYTFSEATEVICKKMNPDQPRCCKGD